MVTNIIIIEPINKTIDEKNTDTQSLKLLLRVLTSFTTIDKISPYSVLSKYLSGNLFIFFDISLRNLFDILLVTIVDITL